VAERYKGEVARLEALLAKKDVALNQTQADLAAAQSQVARWHWSLAEHEKRAEGKTCAFYLGPVCIFGLVFLISHFLFCFSTELERKVVEATSAAEALQRSLDAEVSDSSVLESVVTSACEGHRVTASGSSLQSRVEALYSRAGERMREALHAEVKKALAVVSSHYAGIDLPAVCEGYVLPDDETEAQEEVQRLEDAATAPGDTLAAFFDDEVELPSLRAQGPAQAGQQGHLS